MRQKWEEILFQQLKINEKNKVNDNIGLSTTNDKSKENAGFSFDFGKVEDGNKNSSIQKADKQPQFDFNFGQNNAPKSDNSTSFFNFNSKEYQELKKEVIECKNTAKGIEKYIECLTNFRKAQRSC